MNKSILKEIEAERQEQGRRWGGAESDDKNSVLDWVAIICVHAGRAIKKGKGKEGWYPPWRIFRTQMVKVAALAIAAIEYTDRKKDVSEIAPARGLESRKLIP